MQNASSPMSAISLSSVRLVSLPRRLLPPVCLHAVDTTTEQRFRRPFTTTLSSSISNRHSLFPFLRNMKFPHLSSVSRMLNIPPFCCRYLFPCSFYLSLSPSQLPNTHVSSTCVRSGTDGQRSLFLSRIVFPPFFLSLPFLIFIAV